MRFKEITFTARNSSCGKVVFSQACVKNSVHGGCVPCHACPPHACPLPCTPPAMHAPPARTPPLPRTFPLPRTPPPFGTHAVNERVVRILLECILVKDFYIVLFHFHFNLAGYFVTCTLTFREPWIISKNIRYIDTEFPLSQLPQQW